MIIALTGPTCSGKTSIERELHKLGYGAVASHTTRQPRPGEVSGRDYCFVARDEMQAMLAGDELIEFNEFGGALYGLSKAEVLLSLSRNSKVAVVLDPNGKRNLREWALLRSVPFVATWVECSPAVQAKRFAARVAQLPSARLEDFLADRLTSMLGLENQWRERTGVFRGSRYELRMSSDSLTSQNLASFIDSYVCGLTVVQKQLDL